MAGQPGPYEAALIGTPIADPENPLEVLRTVHSFDPCMACGVHLLDVKSKKVTEVKLDPRTSFVSPLMKFRAAGNGKKAHECNEDGSSCSC